MGAEQQGNLILFEVHSTCFEAHLSSTLTKTVSQVVFTDAREYSVHSCFV